MATLRQLRIQKKWTQAQLALKAALSESTVGNAERGVEINRLTAQKIADALGVKVEEIDQLKVLAD